MSTVAEIVVQEWLKSYTPEERARLNAVANQVWDIFRKVKETADSLAAAALRAAERADISHERGELLRIYRQRRKWKKADISRLNTYRLNKAARRRVMALANSRSFGPGTTVPFQTWTEQISNVGQYFVKVFDPSTKSVERLRLLRRHASWYPQFIEMTYRGEYERLKQLGVSAAHDAAEQAVADAFLISREGVRKFCGAVRKDSAAGHTMSTSITVAELEMWKQSGCLPKRDSPV